jgi:hypothetical protein
LKIKNPKQPPKHAATSEDYRNVVIWGKNKSDVVMQFGSPWFLKIGETLCFTDGKSVWTYKEFSDNGRQLFELDKKIL